MPSAFSHVPLTHRSTRGQTQKLTLEESPGGFGGWASTGQLEYLCQCEWGGCLSISWALFLEFCVWLAYIGLQEAIFNKSTGKVILKTFSLYKKLLSSCNLVKAWGGLDGSPAQGMTGLGHILAYTYPVLQT